MSFLGAIRSGFRRVLRAKRMAVALWLVSLLVALPAAWGIGSILEESIGAGLAHEKLRESFDLEWYWKFQEETEGIAATFTPGVVGAGAFYDNLEAWVTGDLFDAFPALVALGILYALLWTFLMGGVLARLARHEEPVSLQGFLQAGGRYFFRFVRLAILTAVPYLLIYLASRWFYDRLYHLTRDVTREWTVFGLSLLTLAVTSFLLVVMHLASDYAKIATVAEEGRGMLRALVGGFRFVLSHPGGVLGIYYGIALVSAILLAIYAMLAPGAGQSTIVGIAFAFIAGQAFLFVRLIVRLTLLGSQTAYFQAMSRTVPR
jgi:hypothetical protein